MANNDVFNCPFCDGHGQLRRSEILDRMASGGLGEKIERQFADIAKSGDEQKELTGMPASGSKALDFQREVHSWNPQQPLWRRSQKE
jgi:serine/threonine protein phosphatase PrpC